MKSVINLKIYYEDTDAAGIVYYANYLKYFERARTEMFYELGLSVRELLSKGIMFVVTDAEVHYYSPAQLGDILEIETQITEVKRVSVVFCYSVRRVSEQKVLVDGKTKLAVVNLGRKIVKLPVEVYEKLSSVNLSQ